MVEGPVKKISHAENIDAIKAMKTRKAAEPSEVNFEVVASSDQVK